jgi:hypothetical protein
MPSIGPTIHGVDLSAFVTKDFSTGRRPDVGRGERTPFARGSTRFSGSDLTRIKLTTVGQPTTRATRITEKSVRTASRAMGEALGALASGSIPTAGKWLSQARQNLEPMLDKAVLDQASELSGRQHTPKEVADHILLVRLGKHLTQIDDSTLFTMAKLLNTDSQNELGPDGPLLRQAVIKEADARLAGGLGAIRAELSNPTLDAGKAARRLNDDVEVLIDRWIVAKRLKGEPLPQQNGVDVLPFAMSTHIRMKLISEITDPDKMKQVAQLIEPSRLAAMAKNAKEPLLGVLKEVITQTLVDRMNSITGPLAALDPEAPDKIAPALEAAYSDFFSILKVAQQLESHTGETTLSSMLKAGFEGVMTSVFENVAKTDGLLEKFSSKDLTTLLEIGGKAGVNLEELPASKINIRKQVRTIATARIESSYPEVRRLGQAVLTEMSANPIHLERLWTSMNAFRAEVTRGLAHHHRVLDPSIPMPEEGDGEIYAAMILDHMAHFSPDHPRSNRDEALDLLVPDLSGDSVKQLPYRTTDLTPEMLAPFSTAELTRLHYHVCSELKNSKYKSDEGKQQLIRNQKVLEDIMLDRKFPMVNALLDNHAVEASLSIVSDQGKKHISRMAQLKGERTVTMTNIIFTNFLLSQGMNRFCQAFDPYILNKPETHHVDFGDDRFESWSSFYNAARDEAAEKAFPGGRLPEGTTSKTIQAQSIVEGSWAGRNYLRQLPG